MGLPALRDASPACIASYAQRHALNGGSLGAAKRITTLQLSSIAQIWKGGCIIRARLLQRIQMALTTTNPQADQLDGGILVPAQITANARLRQVVAAAARPHPPCPA